MSGHDGVTGTRFPISPHVIENQTKQTKNSSHKLDHSPCKTDS